MADITRMGFLRHLRADASSHVLLYRGARLRRSGRGLAFWFSPFAVSVAEVPVDDREVALAVHGRSADFQDVVVQGSVTFRVVNPELTAARVDFSIDQRRGTSVKPDPEVERALEAPTRERIQEEADEATFRRRAQAVDKERAIQENEMQNQIELAKREQQLIDQRGQNARREATEKAEAARIESEAQAGRTRLATEAQAAGIRAVDGARTALEKERLDAYRTMPANVIAGLAAQELAGKLQRIDHLNITPELLGPLFANLLEAGTKRLGGPDPAPRKVTP